MYDRDVLHFKVSAERRAKKLDKHVSCVSAWAICNTGNAHAYFTDVKERVQCVHCLAAMVKQGDIKMNLAHNEEPVSYHVSDDGFCFSWGLNKDTKKLEKQFFLGNNQNKRVQYKSRSEPNHCCRCGDTTTETTRQILVKRYEGALKRDMYYYLPEQTGKYTYCKKCKKIQ